MEESDAERPGALQQRLRELEETNEALQSEATELREKARNFEALADSATCGLLIALDPEHHVYANRRAAAITGYSVEELLGLSMSALVPPDERPQILENSRQRLAGTLVPYPYETQLVHKDGHLVPVEVSAATTAWQGQPADMVLIHDLTEAHRADAALRESEERYRHLIDTSPYSISVVVDGRIVFMNQAGVQLLGAANADEVIGRATVDFVLPDQRESIAEITAAALQSPEAVPHLHQQLVRLDGRRIDVEVQIAPIVYEQQSALRVVMRDVTERRRARERRRRTNAALRGVLTIADELIACPDTDALLRRAVELARERLGLERCCIHLVDGELMRGTYGTNLRGETTDERAHSYPAGEHWARIREAEPQMQPWDLLHQPYREWTGETMAVLPTAGPTACTAIQSSTEVLGIFFNDNAISGKALDPDLQDIVAIYCSLLGSITQEQRAEEALRESELRFREMADLLPDIVFETDLDLRLIYANQAAFDTLGYEREDLDRGLRIPDFLDEDQVARAEKHLRHIAAVGPNAPAQYYIRRADGSMLPAEIRTAARMDPNGHLLGFRGVVRDISQRLRIEEAQRMAAIGELGASVAHEFGNILAGMRAWAHAAQKLATEETWSGLLGAVLRGSDRGGALCWNLMRLAHPLAPERKAIRIEGPIEAALSMVAAELQQREVEVLRSYCADPNGHRSGTWVFIDPSQMEQVFLNLFVNASQAMPEGGQLTIETARLPRSGGNGEVRVRVSDTGTGIPAQHLSRIFEPFFSTKPNSEKGVNDGRGLGLSVSYGIVDQHGGTLAVESEIGVGTTFELWLPEYRGPVQAAPDEDTTSTTQAEPAGAGQRILVVDDDQVLRSGIAFALNAEGYEAVVAASTGEALEALENGSFDLLVADLLMPGGGGAQIVRAANARAEPLPVILMTGKAGEALARELMSQGACQCFLKPFDPVELLRAVRTLLVAEET